MRTAAATLAAAAGLAVPALAQPDDDAPGAPDAATADGEPAAPAPWPPPAPAPGEDWDPPVPDPGRKDWLRLAGGELLRGTIERIEDDSVYFDSDVLEDLEIDWDDIESLGSSRLNTYRFEGKQIVTGTARMHGGEIRIATRSGVLAFDRSELFAMIEGELREINYWSFEAGAGVTVRSGNSDQTDASVRLRLERETPLTEAHLSYQSAQSVVEGDEVTNHQRLTGQFAYYLTERLFLVAPTAELYRDRIQNIDLRTTVGAGVGYDLVDRRRVEWNVVVGAAYQRTYYADVEADEDRIADDAAATFATTLETDPLSSVDWDTTYQLALVVTDLDKTNHHLQSVMSIDLVDPVDLDVTFVWDRIEKPRPDEDGNRPESDDLRMTLGLSVDL